MKAHSVGATDPLAVSSRFFRFLLSELAAAMLVVEQLFSLHVFLAG